jgi:hypothetical protein
MGASVSKDSSFSGQPTRRRAPADLSAEPVDSWPNATGFQPRPPISSLSDWLHLRFQPDGKSLQLVDKPATHVILHVFYHLIIIPCHLYQQIERKKFKPSLSTV